MRVLCIDSDDKNAELKIEMWQQGLDGEAELADECVLGIDGDMADKTDFVLKPGHYLVVMLSAPGGDFDDDNGEDFDDDNEIKFIGSEALD